MHTLVLDLHSGLPGLGVAEVVLYRPRAEERLAWLSGPALARASAAQLEQMADAVRTHVARRQVGAWSLLVLLDLPAGGDPLDGSALVDQLDRLHRHVLDRLAAAGRRPSRVVTLALDGLERDHRGVPTDPAARLRWKLDRHGMARLAPEIDALFDGSQQATLRALVAAHPRLLADADLADVAMAWTPIERPAGVRLDQRIATLPPEFRTELEARRDAVLSTLDGHLGLSGNGNETPASSPSRFVRPAVLETIRARLVDDLDALTTMSAWQQFDPAAALRRIVRRTLSMEALTERVVHLRLRLDQQPAPALQRSLLRLAYAVVAIAEALDRPDVLKEARRYAAEVRLDEDRLVALAAAYQGRLERVRRDVRQTLDAPLVESLPLVRDPQCGCSRTLDLRGRFENVERWTRVGPVRGSDDLRWDGWAAGIAGDLDAAEAEADAHIMACVRDEAARFPAPQPHRLDQPLDAFARAEADTFRATQRALLGSVVPGRAAGWDEEAHATAIAPRLYSRPVGRVVALWALGGALVLALPYLAEALATPTPFAPTQSGWLAALVLAGLIPALGVLVGRWIALRRRWREAALAAKEALSTVQARYRLRTDRLAQSCDLRAARQRMEAAHTAQREAGHRRLQLRFHETQLQQHERLAHRLQDLVLHESVGGTATRAPGPTDPVPPDLRLGNGFDPTRPVFANAVYHLTHRPGPPGTPPRLIVNESEHALDTPRLAGLEVLHLDAE